MDTTGGYQSLLGLTSINSNSSTIDVLNVENITIDGVIDLSQAIVGGLTTSQVDEGLNLYYTDSRVNNNSNVSSNTTHRERKDNPHAVTATQVGINSTDDIIEGVTNLYYTDIRFDDRLATKTTTSLAEGSNLYYTDSRFDTRFGIKTTTDLTEGTNLYYTTTRANADFDTRLATKTTTDLTEGTNLYYTDVRFDNRLLSKTTTDLAEGSNLYYTDARFDTRLATKTTTDLTEGTNLYYTDARFDTRFGIKTTTDLTEGTNLYYTDARFDTRFGIKTTTDLTEGTNLYYTETRVSANTDVKANSDYRAVGHLPLAGGTLTGDLTFDLASPPFEMPALTSNTGNPDFIASASSELLPSFTAFEAFNDNDVSDTTEGWHINVPSDLYDGVDNVYNGTTDSTLVDGSPILGQWVQVRTTSIYAINQFYIQTRFNYPDQAPEDFTVAVSSDGTNFTSVYSTTGQSWVSNEKKTYTGITQTTGTYFRLITTKTQSSIYLCIKEWRITFNTGGNIHSISQVLNLNGTNVDTLISDVKANTAKVSADGSIDTHSDVSILDVQDQQFLKYSSFTQKWANVTPTTAMIAEHDNLYYTDARFDTRFATKTTTNLTEGTNLYYTEARFDTSFGVKKTTDLTEGINLYYTDARFDTRLATKTTTNLTEGSNLYYTEARVSANTDVKANSDYRAVGHLPLAGGIMTGDIIWDTDIEIPTWSSNTVYTPSDDPNWLISSSSFYSSSYQTFEAFNKTVDAGGTDCWISASGKYNSNGTVSASTYTTTQVDGSNSYQGEWIQVRHTEKKLRLTSFILTARSLYTEYSKYYRLLGTNDDPTGSPNWTTLMYNTTQLVWGSPGASLVLTPDGVLGYYNTYRLLITQCTIGYCSIARFIPSFVTEGTVIDGTSINGSDIDTLISDVSANTAKVSYPSADSTKVGFISVTQAVNLDTMESDIATNNNKISYPSADSTKVGFISVTQAVDLDTMESDIATNNAYRNVGHLPLAGGSLAGDLTWDIDIELPTWTSDTAYTPSDDPNWSISSSSNLTSSYGPFKAFNKTVIDTSDCWISASGKYNSDGTVKASTYTTTQVDGSNSYQGEWIQIRHTEKKLRLTSFILTTRLTYPEYSKYYRLLGTNDDPTGSPNWTTLMYNTTQLVWSNPGESLVQTPAGVLGYYNTYRLLITQCSVSLCSIGRFIPSFTVSEGTVIDGTSINGTDIDTLIADVSTNTAKVSYPTADSTKVGFISVTQAVNLDTMESDIASKVSADGSINTHSDVNITAPADGHVLTYDTGEWKNLAPAEVTGYLPLDGSTAMTGALNIDPTNHGEKVVFYETTPTEVPYGIQTSNGYIMHGVEYNGSHVFIYDIDGKLATAGYTLQLKRTGSIMNTELSMNNHKITDLTTPTDTADASTKGYVDTAVNAKLSVNGTSIMIGNLNMGNYDIDNVNQVFIDRNGLANNKLVLLDNGSGSTTDFYGFGIGAATLMYNINSTGANHKFYYAGVYELFRIGHSGIYSYRNLDVTGNITVSGTVDGIDIQSLNTTVGGKLSLTGGTMSGNINMGNQDIDNVNQVFVNRSGLANNKLVLYDGGSGSTTSFYGLGIQSSTLMYNVDGSGANHRFYYGGTNEVFRIGNSGVYTYRGLGVTGNILMSTNSRILIDDSTSSVCGIRWSDENHAVYCYRSANQMYIKEYGTIYFQTTGANTRAYINASGLTNLSDRRKKSGIRKMKCCGLDLINALKPVCFTHIGAERESCGFIAQDIEELVEQKKICFNPVSDNRIEKEDGSVDEFKGLCYIDFIAPLVKAVQELSAEVKKLKNRIEILESPII